MVKSEIAAKTDPSFKVLETRIPKYFVKPSDIVM